MHLLLLLFIIGFIIWAGSMVFSLAVGLIIMIITGLIAIPVAIYNWFKEEL